MIFQVDSEKCIGCGLCANTSSEVFQMEGEISTVILMPTPKELEESALASELGCPTGAISHQL